MQKKRKIIGKMLTISAWGTEILLLFKKLNWKRPWSSQIVKGKKSRFCYWNVFCFPSEPADILRQHCQKEWTALSLSLTWICWGATGSSWGWSKEESQCGSAEPLCSRAASACCGSDRATIMVGAFWGKKHLTSPVMLTAHLSLKNPCTVDFKLVIVAMKGVN